MRLLNTKTYAFHDRGDLAVRASPEYAILSHRWQPPEISLQTFNVEELRNSNLYTPQLDKIRKACVKARERDPPLEWIWIDSCCIDKSNAVEETKSINSMFEWYRAAAVCIAYLHDVDENASPQALFESTLSWRAGQKSEWFTRGWTLQELLAPRNMEFYGQTWKFMGTKKDLAGVLETLSGISKDFLTGERNFRTASISTRMSWMAGRTTTMIEDIAYSLIGLLNINMALQYGEGTQAFMRLQRTLIESSTDESIFAWTIPKDGLQCYRGYGEPPVWSPTSWGLLAPSPDCFAKYKDIVIIPEKVVTRLAGGYRWTQQGVSFQMPMKAGNEASNWLGLPRSNVIFPLNCWRYGKDGKPLTVQIHLVKRGALYSRVQCEDLDQKRGAKPGTNKAMGIDQLLTRPLTVEQPILDLLA